MLPDSLLETTTVIDGQYYFSELPPQLSRRLWYDPTTQKVYFEGQYVTLTSSSIGLKGYLLLNVINDRDHNLLTNVFAPYEYLNTAIEELCQASKDTIIVTNSSIPFDSLALQSALMENWKFPLGILIIREIGWILKPR